MDSSQISPANGHVNQALEHHPRAGISPPTGSQGLGDVVKDALDHASAIVSNSVEIGKLEAKRVVGRVEQTTKEVAPRIVAGAAAAVLGFAGAVFALIAIFVGLGEIIPSVAVRLGIYAAVFLLLAAAGGYFAARPIKEPQLNKLATKGPSGPDMHNNGPRLASTEPVSNLSK